MLDMSMAAKLPTERDSVLSTPLPSKAVQAKKGMKASRSNEDSRSILKAPHTESVNPRKLPTPVHGLSKNGRVPFPGTEQPVGLVDFYAFQAKNPY